MQELDESDVQQDAQQYETPAVLHLLLLHP